MIASITASPGSPTSSMDGCCISSTTRWRRRCGQSQIRWSWRVGILGGTISSRSCNGAEVICYPQLQLAGLKLQVGLRCSSGPGWGSSPRACAAHQWMRSSPVRGCQQTCLQLHCWAYARRRPTQARCRLLKRQKEGDAAGYQIAAGLPDRRIG